VFQLVIASSTVTGWRRLIGCLKLQVLFRKRVTNYMALLRKMTSEDKAFYGSSPHCDSKADNWELEAHVRYAGAIQWWCYSKYSPKKNTYGIHDYRTHLEGKMHKLNLKAFKVECVWVGIPILALNFSTRWVL